MIAVARELGTRLRTLLTVNLLFRNASTRMRVAKKIERPRGRFRTIA